MTLTETLLAEFDHLDEAHAMRELAQYTEPLRDKFQELAISYNVNIITGSISCNPGSPVSEAADFPIEVVVGPEFVTGSTRMKSGTAQKLVLNMISTSVMIQLGRVEDNKMVNMQLTNDKLIDRGTRMLMERIRETNYSKAKDLLLQYGSVKKAADAAEE